MYVMCKNNLEKNIELWSEVLKEDKHWDFTFLEKIILHKLKLMRKYYLDGNSIIVQETVDEITEEMTIVIEALERLLEDNYINFPEGKSPKIKFKEDEETSLSKIVFEYDPEFGSDKIDKVYEKAEENRKRDRALVYNTLRDKSPKWWD